jgi:hypothetical protein
MRALWGPIEASWLNAIEASSPSVSIRMIAAQLVSEPRPTGPLLRE